MDESYLAELQKRAAVHKSEVDKLAMFKTKLLKEVNDLRKERDQSRGGLDIFVRDEIDRTTQALKEVKDSVNKEIKRNKDRISALNKKARDIKKREENLKLEKCDMDEKERSFRVWEASLNERATELQDTIWLAQHMAIENSRSRAKSREMVAKAREVSQEAEAAVKEFAEYEAEKARVIFQRELLLEKEYGILKAKQQMLDDGMGWVEDQEKKIKSQWEQLLSAKEYIDNHKS